MGMLDEDALAQIREAREQWERETLDPSLDGGERQDRFATVSNHEVDRLYTPDEVADIDYTGDIGFPGVDFPDLD